MSFKRAWLRPALPLTAALALVLAACGGGNEASNGNGGNAGGGEIFVSGSSTVEPITNRVAEAYAEENADFQYTVEGPGTGDGFALFCNDETDISDASRAIKDEEAAACADRGVEYVELLVAYDGLSVVTSTDNTDVDCLSFLDLYALLGPESEGFDSWSDANDLAAELEGELGDEFGASHAPYPDAALDPTAPGEESGTFDSFVEIVIADIAEARGTDDTTRPDYTASANDNVIIEGIAGSPSSLGWVGLAFAAEAPGVKLLEIDGGDGCVAPSDETVADESYPIARPLFIYPNLASVEQNAALASFVDYYVSAEGLALAGEVGYVALTEEQGQATRDAWEAR
ncbi:MAG TPA: substrate-binding domain-containing protein [Candidatus Limnocylindria bacterium]